jgi:hypothetical protein
MISPPAPPASARMLIATGSFLVGAGDLFLAPFALNARAQQNDVFLGNLFVGLLACLLGGILVAAGLTGLGLRRRAAIVLALGQPLGAGLALALLGQIGVSSMAALSVLAVVQTLGLALLGTALAVQAGRVRAWGRLLALPGLGALLLTVAYLLVGGRYYAYGETVSSLPPYLNLPVFGLTLAVTAVVGVAAMRWRARGASRSAGG